MSAEPTIKNLRKELREIGYKLQIRTRDYSDLLRTQKKVATILSPEGHKINGSQWFGSKDEAQAWSEKHAQALEIKAKYKGNLFDNGWRVVL